MRFASLDGKEEKLIFFLLSSERLSRVAVNRRVEEYVTGRNKCSRPHKKYIFLIRINSRVDLAVSVCASVCMNVEISETIRASDLGLGMQTLVVPRQHKFAEPRPL
ncbi:uncharacterized protein LOC121467305 [Drosophila elegans]|uniref:uncharacterized protein LOC121467305 n=1 Tax=Drosophila elegans TaxID=30023 RepID=UPI001BC85F7E|nr:uncharacterized protein LOC121467305 [Drosophila elegans]